MNTKTKNLILVILVVIVASSVPAIIFGKWLEAIIFILSHIFIRPQFPKEYHNIMPRICREITGCVCFFGISFVLPLELSLMSAIPITYFIGWIGNKTAQANYYQNKCEKLQEKYCNEKENLLLNCRNAKLSERDTIIALKYYYEHQTPKDIWLWLLDQKKYEPIEWDSIYVTLWRIGQKLNKK